MQKLEVLIEENAFGSVRPVEVVADAPLAALVPALVEELQLPQTDLFGKKLVYMLRQASGGPILPENTTLEASGIAPGTRLSLDSYVVDGSVAALMSNKPPLSLPDSTLYSSATMGDGEAFALPQARQTSSLLPAYRKKKRRWTRRAVLLLGGATVGMAGAGVAYAASHGELLNVFNGFMQGAKPARPVAQQEPAVKPPAPAKMTIPTKATPVLSFTRHQQEVRAIGWSPDGKMLASGGDDKRVFIWGRDGAVAQTLPFQAGVRALAWSPDGKRLVTALANQLIFFDAMTGQQLGQSGGAGHTRAITSLAWAKGGQGQVVSGAQDTLAIVWNTTSYQMETVFKRHTTAVDGVTWSPDGQTVASATFGGVMRVWNAASTQELHGAFQIGSRMRVAAFAPAGMQLAVGGDDGMVRIWNGLVCQNTQMDAALGDKCVDTPLMIQAAKGSLRALAWSPNGQFLATGGDDGMLAIWNPAQGQTPLLTLAQQNPVRSIAWSPDGTQVAATVGKTVMVWQLA